MRTRGFVVAATIASALAVAGCKQEAKAPELVRPVLSAILQPVASGSTVAVGTVQPRYETNLGFRVLGRLIARPVNVGDLVVEGQMVAAIDPTALELAVQSAKADLSKAEALLENAIGTEERKRILIRTDAATKQTLDDAERVRGRASIDRPRPGEPHQGHRAVGLCGGEGRLRRRRHGRERRGGTSGLAGSERRDRGATGRPGGCRRYRRGLPGAVDRRFAVHRQPTTASCRSSPGPIREIAPQANSVTRMRRVRIALNEPPESFRLGSTITVSLSNGHSSDSPSTSPPCSTRAPISFGSSTLPPARFRCTRSTSPKTKAASASLAVSPPERAS